MGLTQRQMLLPRRAAAGAARDRHGHPHRRRDHDQPRHDRRVHQPARARQADLRRVQQDVFKTEIIAAGGLAIALALVADALLVVVQRPLTPVDDGRDRSPTPSAEARSRDAFRFVGDHGPCCCDKTLEHLELCGAALGIALVIALPLGVVLGHLHRGSFIAINISNIGRALPSIALIAFGPDRLGSASSEQRGRARRARPAADPDERLRRRSTASTATSSRPRGAWA